MMKHCPRCSTLFECKNDNIMECDCLTVPLSPKDIVFIAKQFEDCLCTSCLSALQEERTKETATLLTN